MQINFLLTVSCTYTYTLCKCSSFIAFINVIHVNKQIDLELKRQLCICTWLKKEIAKSGTNSLAKFWSHLQYMTSWSQSVSVSLFIHPSVCLFICLFSSQSVSQSISQAVIESVFQTVHASFNQSVSQLVLVYLHVHTCRLHWVLYQLFLVYRLRLKMALMMMETCSQGQERWDSKQIMICPHSCWPLNLYQQAHTVFFEPITSSFGFYSNESGTYSNGKLARCSEIFVRENLKSCALQYIQCTCTWLYTRTVVIDIKKVDVRFVL